MPARWTHGKLNFRELIVEAEEERSNELLLHICHYGVNEDGFEDDGFEDDRSPVMKNVTNTQDHNFVMSAHRDEMYCTRCPAVVTLQDVRHATHQERLDLVKGCAPITRPPKRLAS